MPCENFLRYPTKLREVFDSLFKSLQPHSFIIQSEIFFKVFCLKICFVILTVVYCLTPWTLVNRYINQFLFSKIGKILSFPTPEYIPHGLNLVHTYYYTSPSFLVECSILAIFSHCHNILHWLYLKTNSPQNFSFVWHILVLHIWTEAKLYIVLDSHKNITIIICAEHLSTDCRRLLVVATKILNNPSPIYYYFSQRKCFSLWIFPCQKLGLSEIWISWWFSTVVWKQLTRYELWATNNHHNNHRGKKP